MVVGNNVLLHFVERIWNRDIEKKKDWKGSWPEWKWGKSLTIDSWFHWRRQEEGAENLWRIHEKLYNLDEWANHHPGGSSWIKSTKGTDITEAFECHHISDRAEKTLPKFYVRDAKTPRNSPFTFNDDGFFRTLKREIRNHVDNNTKTSARHLSRLLTDSLLISTLMLAVLGAAYRSYGLCVISGIILCLLTICAHNYFHQKDNFRMYYFNLSLLSYRDWRISHAMSHHLYPNSRYDLEVSMFAPFLQWLPTDDKTVFARYVSWLYSPIVYVLIFHMQAVTRLFTKPDGLSEVIPLIYPVSMVLLGGSTILQAIILWQVIILTASFTFGVIGLNAAHHHPDIFHDGDYAREDKDWGLYQIDAVRDKVESKGCLPFVMVTFGDHTLHHLFPTLDHADLDPLYPVFMDVCNKFGYDFTFTSMLELTKGQFQQLARTQPKNNCKPLNPTEIDR